MFDLKPTLIFIFTTLPLVLSNGAFAQFEPTENPDAASTGTQSVPGASHDESAYEPTPKETDLAEQRQDAVAPTQGGESASEDSKIRVEFRVNQPGLTFNIPTVVSEITNNVWEYQRLCVAPCETMLAPGEYQLAISSETREPVLVEETIELSEPSVVEGVYRSYTPERMAGWLILGLGAISGLGMGLAGVGYLTNDSDLDDEIGTWIVAGGATTFALSLIVGSVLASKDDKAEAFLVRRAVRYP